MARIVISPETKQAIIQYHIANENTPHKSIGEHFGLTQKNVTTILRHHKLQQRAESNGTEYKRQK